MDREVPSAKLAAALDERHGFETDVGQLTVFGRGAGCRRAADA